MVLNNKSYVHVTIRKLCSQLELLTDTKLITDLGSDFNEIRFINKFGYIVIDFKHNAVFTLSNKLNEIEFHLVQDIILYCDWLEIGHSFSVTKM